MQKDTVPASFYFSFLDFDSAFGSDFAGGLVSDLVSDFDSDFDSVFVESDFSVALEAVLSLSDDPESELLESPEAPLRT